MELRTEHGVGDVHEAAERPQAPVAEIRWWLAATLAGALVLGLGVWIGRATAPDDPVADEPDVPSTTVATAPPLRVLATVPPSDTVPASVRTTIPEPSTTPAPDEPDRIDVRLRADAALEALAALSYPVDSAPPESVWLEVEGRESTLTATMAGPSAGTADLSEAERGYLRRAAGRADALGSLDFARAAHAFASSSKRRLSSR